MVCEKVHVWELCVVCCCWYIRSVSVSVSVDVPAVVIVVVVVVVYIMLYHVV